MSKRPAVYCYSAPLRTPKGKALVAKGYEVTVSVSYPDSRNMSEKELRALEALFPPETPAELEARRAAASKGAPRVRLSTGMKRLAALSASTKPKATRKAARK